jgi:hypothetical protein
VKKYKIIWMAVWPNTSGWVRLLKHNPPPHLDMGPHTKKSLRLMDITPAKYDEVMTAISTLVEKADDRFFDLKGLSGYASLAVPTLRDHLRAPGGLPHFKVKGKILVKKSEFDSWLEAKFRARNDLDVIVDGVLESLKSDL